MELREFETVRPTTQQGLVAAKPQTPLPSRNVIDSSYYTTQLHRLKGTLIEESRQNKAKLEHLAKELERQTRISQRYQDLTQEVKTADGELRVASSALEKCLQGVSPDEIAKQIDEANQKITELKNEIPKLEKSLSDAKSTTSKDSIPTLKPSLGRLHDQIQSEALMEWMMELLWEKTELQIKIDQKERELGDDIAILDQYYRLTQFMEADAKLHSKKTFHAYEDENQVVSEIDEITQRIANIKTAFKELHSNASVDYGGVNEVQEMKDFLVQYPQLCKDQEQSLHNEEEHIIALLDALVGQQTRNDLFKKLSANQASDQSKVVEALLNQLEQKQIELQKVDVLEEKIEKELILLTEKLENFENTETADREAIEELTNQISSLSTENQSLKGLQDKLQEKNKGIEAHMEMEAGYLDVKEDLKEESVLRERLKELESEQQQMQRSETMIQEQKAVTLDLLQNFNSTLMQTTTENHALS